MYEYFLFYQNSYGLFNKDSYIINSHIVRKNIRTMHDFTRTGFSGYGVKKVNQDNFFIYKNFLGNPNYMFLGVW